MKTDRAIYVSIAHNVVKSPHTAAALNCETVFESTSRHRYLTGGMARQARPEISREGSHAAAGRVMPGSPRLRDGARRCGRHRRHASALPHSPQVGPRPHAQPSYEQLPCIRHDCHAQYRQPQKNPGRRQHATARVTPARRLPTPPTRKHRRETPQPKASSATAACPQSAVPFRWSPLVRHLGREIPRL